MPVVTLKTNASLATLGFKFLKDVPRTDIPYEVAIQLMDRADKFNVKISAAEHQAAANAEGKPTDQQRKIQMIASAINELDPEDPNHYTPSGVPDARALTKLLGWQVTRSDRDEGWKLLKTPRKSVTQPSDTQAPSAREKGDATRGDFKLGKQPKAVPEKSKADRIIEREEAREAARAAAQNQHVEDDEDDADLPPIGDIVIADEDDVVDVSEAPEVETEEEGEEGDGSDVDASTADDFSADAGDDDEAGEGDEEASVGINPIGQKGVKLAPSRKTAGKLLLKGGTATKEHIQKLEQVDPTTSGAKEV